jgi:hypothetical protein
MSSTAGISYRNMRHGTWLLYHRHCQPVWQRINILMHVQQVPGPRVVLCATAQMWRPAAAAAAAAAAVQALLAGDANIDARYRLPDGRTVTPLTWAAICYGANKNNTEYGYPGFSIEVLLEAGAHILVHEVHIACSCYSSKEVWFKKKRVLLVTAEAGRAEAVTRPGGCICRSCCTLPCLVSADVHRSLVTSRDVKR